MINLRVQNFRSHLDSRVQFADDISIITGKNGSGKTSLIEAIYIAYTGKSWRSNFDEINRRDGDDTSDWWRIDILNGDDQRTIKYLNGQKTFIINDKTYKRLPISAKRPVLLFEPGDMQLLYGSPSRRRQFLDRFISQFHPDHQTNLTRFEKTLKQRNNLLKQESYSTNELMVWDLQFAALSYAISNRRRQYLQKINNMLSDKYQRIATDSTTVKASFLAGAPDSEVEIIDRLSRDKSLVTPVGAQKDDYRFLFGRRDAKNVASRGENRTIIFAMLGAMVDIARELVGEQMIILLDDIDSELDADHRRELYKLPSWSQNTIATTLEYLGGDHHHINLS